MRNKKSKEIRKVLGKEIISENPIFKRAYRRLKKIYARTPEKQKSVLLQTIQEQYGK